MPFSAFGIRHSPFALAMFSTDDTIVAIATPPGRGGIGVVRISGPEAAGIAGALTGRVAWRPRHATLSTIRNGSGTAMDTGIVTLFRAPHSYTGEDVVELSVHGTPVVLEAIVAAAIAAGARLANPGEFTFRAYLNGRMDLVQAEAVADLVDSVTPVQAQTALDQLDGTLTQRIAAIDARVMDLIARLEASLDFPEEGYHFVQTNEVGTGVGEAVAALDALLAAARRGRMIREGFTVAIVGRPNVGKSSLFNRLAGADRAIVTDVPGTTRDLVTERINLDGLPLTVVDTAGTRDVAADAVEEEGIARARAASRAADLAIVVLDRSRVLTADDEALLDDTMGRPRVVVASKCDLPAAWNAGDRDAVPVSAMTDSGLDALRRAVLRAMDVEPTRDRPAIANVRHVALLERARDALTQAAAAARAGHSEEFVLADLHDARAAFDEVTGVRTPDDVLRMIFERFCIGK